MDDYEAIFGLRAKREAAQLSQADLAERLKALDPEGAWDQSKVSRYENNEDSVPAVALVKILRVLGETSIPVTRPQTEGINLGTPYAELFAKITDRSTCPNRKGSRFGQQLATTAREVTRRPLVGVFGAYDAGKSTAINALLGANKLPTGYQPQTFLVTYIHHIDERPDELDNDVFLVDEQFDPNAWRDGDDLKRHTVTSGSLDLLEREAEAASDRVSAAIVFLDSPVLLACSLVDTPGSLEDLQTVGPNSPRSRVLPLDAAILCDPCNGFMNSEALAHLGDVVASLTEHGGGALERLLVLATHAHARVTVQHLSEAVIPGGSRRIAKFLEVRSGGGSPSTDQIAKRIVPFDPEVSTRVDTFMKDFADLVGAGSVVFESHASRIVAIMERERIALTSVWDGELKVLNETLSQRTSQQSPLSVEAFRNTVLTTAADVTKVAEIHRTESKAAALTVASKFDAREIERIIRERFPDKKDAREGAALHVLQLINVSVEHDLQARLDDITTQFEEFMVNLQSEIPKFATSGGDSTFDFRTRVFGAAAGAGFGAAGVGAIGAYAATLGNLGAYILVAKGVSALSALGISVGGVGPAVSVIAALGGPMTLGIATVAGLTMLGFTVAGRSWQRALSKQIHKKLVTGLLFPNRDAKDPEREEHKSIPQALDTFWQGVMESLDGAAGEAIRAYIDLMKARTKVDIPALQARYAAIRSALDWVTSITYTDLFESPRPTPEPEKES